MDGLRRHPLLAMVITAAVMLAVGLVAGHFVTSPAQVAADAAAPALTTLTAPVEFGRVQSTETADAKLQATGLTTVTPAPPSEADRAVVSAVRVKVGDTVKAGDSLVDVAGRPTFVMKGKIEAYRTMGPGMTGRDVRQLQAGLRAAGYPVAKSEKSFGASTKQAVTSFYADSGYPLIAVGEDEVDAAADALVAAERAVASAETTLRRAQRDHDAAVRAANESKEARPNRDSVDDAELAVEQAREDRTKAGDALEDARAASGPQVPLGEVTFLRHLPATVDQIKLSAGKEVGDGTILLATGEVSAVATFATIQTESMSKGNTATIITPDGTASPGTVTSITALQSEDGNDQTQVTVLPDKPLDKDLEGTTLRVDVSVARAKDETLMVPEAAVVTGADGSSRVRVEEGTQQHRDVPVVVGDAGDGMVAVTPESGAELAEGDLVVVGVLG